MENKKEQKKNPAFQESIWEGMLTSNVAAITDLAVSKGLEQARQSFEAFKTEVEARMNELVNSKSILHFTYNENPELKLTTRASKALPRLVANAKLGLNTLMVGPAGCGKTTAAHQLSEALQLQFGSVCLTAGASETWLFGRQTPTGFIEGAFSKIYREGGVFLADEMDAADANLLLSINTALSHSKMLNPMNGEVIEKHKDFVFVGAANTNGKGSTHVYTGRSRLDAATMDRMVIVMVTYDTDLERQLCPESHLSGLLFEIRNKLKLEEYDEFVSTRAFSASYKQRRAGVPLKDIMDSLTANWGESAKKIADNSYEDVKQRFTKGDDTFYAQYLSATASQQWRPVQWDPNQIPL